MKSIDYWVEKLQLQSHPEGGFYKENYRSELNVSDRNGNRRSASTGIYFLMTSDNFSAFHKIESDEMWHFYEGAPLSVYIINTNGELEVLKIGRDIENGEVLQAVVPAGCWFASRVDEDKAYSLVGCTVAPGFHFDDFVLAKRKDLQFKYPNHSELIKELTRS